MLLLLWKYVNVLILLLKGRRMMYSARRQKKSMNGFKERNWPSEFYKIKLILKVLKYFRFVRMKIFQVVFIWKQEVLLMLDTDYEQIFSIERIIGGHFASQKKKHSLIAYFSILICIM